MPLDIREIKRRLKSRHDLEEDELNVLFAKDEKAIRDFYDKSVLIQQKVGNKTAKGEDEWPEMKYKLTPGEEAQVQDANRVVAAKEKAKQQVAKARFEEAGKAVKPTEKVDFDEWLQAQKGLRD